MSFEQISPLIINTVAGAATGYITNDYAVKMLFRKYGPFGGVLLATKEKFVQSMADLVERDIINAQTLSNNLAHPETQKVLRTIINDTTKKYLYQNTPDLPLHLVDGVSKTVDNFLNNYQKHAPAFMENLLTTFLQHTPVDKLFVNQQQDFLADKLFDLLYTELKNSFAAEQLVQNFYAQNQEKTLTDFIPAEVFSRFIENLQKHLNTKVTDSVAPEISPALLQEIFQAIDLKKLWSDFIEHSGQKNLYEIFGQDNLANIWRDFVTHIAEILQSAEGQILLTSAVDNIFMALKNVELSLFDLLETGLQNKVLNFLQEHLPAVIEKIITWFHENKNELEELINSSIDDVLNKEQNDLFGKAKKFLKDAMYENVAGKQELIAKIIYAIQNDLDGNTISEELTAYLIKYLQNTSVSEIISKLENMGIITKNDLVILLNTLLKNYAQNPDLKLVTPILHCKLHDLCDLTTAQTLYQHLEKFCGNHLHQYSWQTHLLEQLSKLPGKPLAALCSLEQAQALATAGQLLLLEQLSKNKTVCTKSLAKIIEKNITEKNLTSILPANFSQINTNRIVLSSTKYLTEYLQNPNLGTVYQVLDKLNQNEKFGKLAPAVMIKLLQRNFDTLLTGNVSTAVQNNLSALEDQELQNIVENFMGKELGPINIIGAVMGAIAGAGCYTLGLGNLSPNLWLNALSSATVFGLIGYTTNVLAIKMIFRPYKKWQIHKLALPCTPGIIAKQKPRFAISMAEFIDESLLNKDKLQEYFQDKRATMEISLYDLLARDNFQLFKDFTQSNLVRLSKQILSLTASAVHNNKETSAKKLQNILLEQTLTQQDFLPLENFMQQQNSQLLSTVEQISVQELTKFADSKKTLQDFISANFQEKSAENILRKQCQYLAQLIASPDKLETFCQTYQPAFVKLCSQPLRNIFTGEGYLNFKQERQSQLKKKLQTKTTQQQLAQLLDENIFSELKSNKTIGELFDGKIIALLQDNSPALLHFITKRGLSILQTKRVDLKATISKKAEQEHSFLFHALDVGSTISAIVDNFLDTKVPAFVQEKEADLLEFIITFINTDLHTVPAQDLGLVVEQKSLENVLAKIVDSPNMSSFLDIAVAIILDLIFARPVQDILKVTDLQTLPAIYKCFAPELNTLQNNLAQNINRQESKLVAMLQPLVLDIFSNKILSLPLDELMFGINSSIIEKSCHNIVHTLAKSDYWESIFNQYLHICSKTLQTKKLDDLLDTELLSTTIISAVENLLVDKNVKKILLEKLTGTLEQMDFDQILATTSKEYLAKLISKSFIDSLAANFLELLFAMNIKDIAHEQINAMSPEEIEKMFYSFAAPYFRKVEMYGGAAAIFGLALAPLLK